jgi:limonene-1,2-epoxide hydrolase
MTRILHAAADGRRVLTKRLKELVRRADYGKGLRLSLLLAPRLFPA